MSRLDYHSETLKQGIERLKLLGRHSELLMQAYYGQPLDEVQIGTRVINQLTDANILQRLGEASGLNLSDPVRQVIVQLIADEQRRKVNADIGEFLVNIRKQATRIFDAEQKGRYQDSARLQEPLKQEVDDLNSRIATGIKSLWNRLNTDFAFVSTVQEKIEENEKAHTEVLRWIDGLELISFQEMIEISGDNGGLRHMLVRQLQSQVSEHFASLREVQSRLRELMARFRQQQARNMLVRGMLQFFQETPNFQPSAYPQRSHVPDLVNQATAVQASVAISLDRQHATQAMQQLLAQLPARRQTLSSAPDLVQALSWQEEERVVAQRRALHEDVVSFYIHVLDQQRSQSALEYLGQSQLDWDAEMWLYQVIAEYGGLSDLEKRAFHLHYHEAKTEPFSDVWVIKDLELQLLSAGVLA